MDSKRRKFTRARKARSVKPSPKPRHKATLSPTRRKPADDKQVLFAILGELVNATSLIVTATRSLEHRESAWDEIATLEAAIKMLRRVDVALNDVADGRPSPITPDEDTNDDEEGE
jgi:hypothetical protein